MLKTRHLWKIAVAWAAVIFILSSIPGPAFPALPVANFDKFAHASVYCVLGFLCFLAIPKSPARKSSTYVLVAGVLVTLYGFSDEFHQLFVPGRSADLRDVFADCIGGFSGAFLASAVPFLKSDEAS
jgi:VanZ family protein